MSYGLSLPGSAGFDILRAAQDQYGRATKGIPAPSDYRKLEDYSIMVKAPSNTVGAYLKCSYWLSVASRYLGGQPKLLALAYSYLQSGAVGSGILFTSYLTRRVSEIMNESIQSLLPYQGNANIKIILAILGHQATEGVATQIQAREDKEVVLNTAKAIQQETSNETLPTLAKWIRPVTWLVGLGLVGVGIWYGRQWLLRTLPPKMEIVQS